MKAASRARKLDPRGAAASQAEQLAVLSGDLYWEQDEAFRFSFVSGGAEGLQAEDLLGRTLWESGALPTGTGWEEHRARLQAREPFSGFAFKRFDSKGELRRFSASGQACFDAAGRFSGYRGTLRDITRAIEVGQRLAIEHAVTDILDEAAHIEEAAPRIIRVLCETLGWACGARWQREAHAQALRCVQTWDMPPAGADSGVAQRACDEGAPAWTLELPGGQGLRSALAFPIRRASRVVGAIELYSRERHRPAADTLDCLDQVGRHIGLFMERAQAAEEQRRFRTAIDVSADLVLLVDPVTLRYVDANETACRALGYSRQELLGMGPLDVFSITREQLVGIYDRLIAGDPGATAMEGWYRRKDGSRLMVESFRRALPSANGHVIVAVARDIGERKRAELLVKLEHAVTLALAGAESVAAGLEAVIRSICETEGWAGGRYWRLDEEAAVLRFGAAWGPPGSAIDKHNQASREVVYRSGAGYVGRVWQSGEPLWIPDAEKDGRGQRTDIAPELRNRSNFLFPVALAGKVIGVMAFNSFEVREPDPRLLQAVRVLGSQIGQFVQRKQAEEEVRESEARFRSLTELSSDFYWETDGEHRLVQTQVASDHKAILPIGQRLGKARWELPSTRPDAAGWAAHRATMQGHRPFRDFEFARVDERGVERHVSISGEPMFDAAGGFCGYRGVGKDITARKRGELLVELEHTVTRALAEAEDGPRALKAIMRAVCEANGWDCGRYFRKGEDGVFRYAECWHRPSPEIERFIEYSAKRSFAPGVGIVGRAGEGEPQWVADIASDSRVVYTSMASEHSMRGAFMFPVMAQGSALGVLSFTSREIREPDERLLEAVRVIGSQIGQFVQRKQAEEVLRESEERFRSLTQLSSDFYWETDAEHRLVRTQYGTGHRPVIGSGQRFGKRRWELPSTYPDAAGWTAHQATLEAHLPFRDFELARVDADGVERHLCISGEPMFDSSGGFRGYRGIGKDITGRKRDEQLLNLEHTVTRCISEAHALSDALTSMIRVICESQGWECGRYFYADETAGLLRFGAAWGVADASIERYIEGSRGWTSPLDRGAKARVWRTGEPLWSSKISRHGQLVQSTLGRARDSFVFAVTSQGKSIGVLSFTSRALRKPDERLLQAVRVIGAQIGQFLRRREAEEVLRESEARFRSVVDSANEGILIYDRSLNVVGGNAAAERIIGRPLAHIVGAAGFTSLVACVREDGAPLTADDRPTRITVRTGQPQTGHILGIKRPEGAITWLSVSTAFLRQPGEEDYYGLVSTFGDITARRQAEAALRESEERFRSLTLLSSDIYWEQDEEFRFTKFAGTGSPRINQAGLPYLGRRRWDQNYVNMSAQDWEKHIELLEAHQPFRDMELCRLDAQGHKVWVSISGEPVFDPAGRFKGYRGVGKDITARKVDEEYIHYLASHDALTALPNRATFSEIVNHAIHNARRYHRGFALLFVDLDRFKIINDTLGHEAGDMLLKQMAQRLADTVRSSDVVARLGGDEFVVLVQEVDEAKQVDTVARKVLAALMRPVSIGEHEYRITASIGIAMYPGDGDDEQSLMKNADIAMYGAKEEGKNTYKFYAAEANAHSFERLALESGLRRGLDENQFLLHYQAKVDVRTGAITGMEALVRWQHPQLGMVPPGQFIPLAEESGLIVPLGKWVLRTACAQNVAWQRQGMTGLRMSVNISARQFADEDLLKDIADALAETGMEAGLLELELTESMVMRNPERALAVLESVKRMGVHLAIDDFGVGYSSLAHLKRFPIDTLKIDRSFIRDIAQDPEDKAIVEAIIAMGKTLNLTVVAEGVETGEQQAFLREHACDEMQGYFFSKPLPAEQFVQLLRAAKPR